MSKQSASWEETKAVKKALADAGFKVSRVGHGRGTACTWLEVRLGENPGGLQHEKVPGPMHSWPPPCRGGCPACDRNQEIDREVYRLVAETTGRVGDYDGRVMVLHQ